MVLPTVVGNWDGMGAGWSRLWMHGMPTCGMQTFSPRLGRFLRCNGPIGRRACAVRRFPLCQLTCYVSLCQSSRSPTPSVPPSCQWCAGQDQGARDYMEDTFDTKLTDSCKLFAVFDGHGGDRAAKHCAKHLLNTVAAHLKQWPQDVPMVTVHLNIALDKPSHPTPCYHKHCHFQISRTAPF